MIIDKILEDGEYYKEVVKKDTIYIHHTAGSHRPDWTIDGWAHDRNKSGGKLPVATAYVIGGLSSTDRDASFDGVVYRAFDDTYWAHHLGLEALNNNLLNRKSVAIEICNYGPIIKTSDGKFLNYVNKEMPADMVAELPVPYRGFTHYHKYTDKQLTSLKTLLQDIAKRHQINLKQGLHEHIGDGAKCLEVTTLALAGQPGVWSHSNVRKDKFDVWPQPQMLSLIASL